MMGTRTNPFEELYVSETVPPSSFVQLFSPFLVKHALPLFQPGNVVLRGTQGSGKSTLLSLLKPSIRLAYAEAGVPFPVPEDHSRFIAAGINFRRSGATNFGQRPFSTNPARDSEQLPLFFADFFNYWVVNDLITTLIAYREQSGGRVADQLGLDASPSRLDEFSRSLAIDPAWFGALAGVQSCRELQNALQKRLVGYVSYLNYNVDTLPAAFGSTKTLAGQPISGAARLLRDSGVLVTDVNVFVQIDQYEELTQPGERRYGPLDAIVNRAVGMRDEHVSFRIGARRYAWPDAPPMHGTKAVLERERDYTIVDLDDLLRRKENVRTFIFPRFAADVMRRRLQVAGYDLTRVRGSLVKHVFGPRPSAEERAVMYVSENRGCAPERIVNTVGLPQPWKTFLLTLAERDPLNAKLAEAWARQGGGHRSMAPPPTKSGSNRFPWNEREYWRKERRDQALMQLAAGCVQRLQWSGGEDIVALSGANILVFVSICRQVWAAYIRATREGPEDDVTQSLRLPRIETPTQSVGIEEASRQWYQKIPELPGGHERQRFINVLGRVFRTRLLEDRAMSYPGHNGFSLAVEDVERDGSIRLFLQRAVDYGDLIESQHTTKEKDRRGRIKWYLKPILSPYFSIPVTHAKEPLYVGLGPLEEWRREADGDASYTHRKSKDRSGDSQLTLLDDR